MAISCPSPYKLYWDSMAISSLVSDVSHLKTDDSTYFKALFPAVSIDIRVLLFIKIWKKNCGRVYSCRLSHSLYSNDKECCKLRAVSLFFLVRLAKRTKYLNDHAREWRPPLFLAASTLARASLPSLIWRKRENARTLKAMLHETIRNNDF